MWEPQPTRRSTARLVVTALTAAGALCAATPGGNAEAAARPATLTLEAPQAIGLAPGRSAFAMPLFFDSDVTRAFNTPVTLTYDLRGVAKIAKVGFTQGGCVAAGEIVTCHDTLASYGAASDRLVTAPHSALRIDPVDGAPLGAQGSYTVTAKANGLRVTGGTQHVEIGGPELKAAPIPGHTGLKVGSLVPVPVSFSNTGDRPSHGLAVAVELDPGLSFARTYRNCRYATATGTYAGYTEAICTFTGPDMRIGETERLASTLAVHVDKQAIDPSVTVLAAPTASPLDSMPAHTVWHQGTGTPIALSVLAPGTPSTVPGGTAPIAPPWMGDAATATWTAHNTADLAATGAKAIGPVGSTVQVTVGARDNGPGSLVSAPGFPLPFMTFTLPPGVTAVKVPNGCFPAGAASPTVYDCSFINPFAPHFLAGAHAAFTFGLRVDQDVRHATGRVQLAGIGSYDTDPADNQAAVTVN